MAAGDDDEPAWPARYAGALRYTLQVSPLLTLGVLAIGRAIAASTSFIGVALHFVVWGALFRFAYEVLIASAHGRREAPEAPHVVESALASGQNWLQALLIAGLLVAAGVGGPVTGVFAALFVGLILPALLITLTVEHNLAVALRAERWTAVARALGPGYFALVAPCVLIVVMQDTAGLILQAGWGVPTIVAYYTLAHALTIATFQLIGRALFEHRDVLGFEAEVVGPLRNPADIRADELLDAIDKRIARGDEAGALAELRKLVAAGASPALNMRYRELLAARGERAALNAHASGWIGQLLATGAERQALALAAESLDFNTAFLPAQVEDVERLARSGERLGLSATAAALAANYARANPRRRDGADLALHAARLLADRLERRTDARKLLEEVRAQARDPEAIEKLDAALVALR